MNAVRMCPSLAEGERECLYTGIEEFNLKGRVPNWSLLPQELIHPGLSNFARAIGGGVGAANRGLPSHCGEGAGSVAWLRNNLKRYLAEIHQWIGS